MSRWPQCPIHWQHGTEMVASMSGDERYIAIAEVRCRCSHWSNVWFSREATMYDQKRSAPVYPSEPSDEATAGNSSGSTLG